MSNTSASSHAEHASAADGLKVAFRDSLEALNDLPSNQAFIAFRTSRGYEHNMYDEPGFWTVVADFANQMEGDDLQTLATKVTLATPRALFDEAQYIKEQGLRALHEENPEISVWESWENRDEARLRLIDYHGMLERTIKAAKEAGQTNTYSVIKNHLAYMAINELADEEIARTANESIDATLRGIRHELAIEQALTLLQSKGGRHFRRATRAMDAAGIDFSVEGYEIWFGIDGKASMNKFRHNDEAQQDGYMIQDGRAIIYSAAPDDAFGDSFFLPDNYVEPLAEHLDATFEAIERRLLIKMGRMAHTA